jgi:hypothetical protein
MPDATRANPIDVLMERASGALAATRYVEAEALSARALVKARRADDFERLARITLPLQEARRQLRMIAAACGPARLIAAPGDVPEPLVDGLYLVQPPLIGLDARTLGEAGLRRGAAVVALAREPLTRDGLWPMVAVSEISCRCKVPPPQPLTRVEDRPSKDSFGGPIPAAWFEAAYEALGDAAIASVDPAEPPAWRVDDCLERLDALPYHERLHQALAEAAREAVGKPIPEMPRRRPQIRDPYSF